MIRTVMLWTQLQLTKLQSLLWRLSNFSTTKNIQMFIWCHSHRSRSPLWPSPPPSRRPAPALLRPRLPSAPHIRLSSAPRLPSAPHIRLSPRELANGRRGPCRLLPKLSSAAPSTSPLPRATLLPASDLRRQGARLAAAAPCGRGSGRVPP